MRTRRAVAFSLAVCAATAVLAAGFAAFGAGAGVRPGAQGGVGEPTRAVTDHEFTVALATAQREAARTGQEVSLDTVIAASGSDGPSNTGFTCGAGRALEISLFGTFTVATSGRVGEHTGSVGEMDFTADPTTGQVCLVSAVEGAGGPDPSATVLFASDPGEPFQS